MECLPKKLKGHTYYEPTNIGREASVKETLDRIKNFKNNN